MEWPLTGREADLSHGLALVESKTGLAILDPTGVGKSRLLQELVDGVRATGVATLRVVASEATRSVPFAPFVDILPDSPTPDRLQLFKQALHALELRASPSGLVLAIDDAHHLDDGSLALLTNVLVAGTATLCFTVRTGSALPPGLVDFWTNGKIERVDLEPLDEARSRTLVESALGLIDDHLSDELWSIAQGNPLLVHELVEGAAGKAIATNERGVWTRTATLTRSSRLADLVRDRIESVPSELRAALELLAVGAPVHLAVLTEAAGTAVAGLDGLGLLATTPTDDGVLVSPSHPVYGEVLEAQLGATRHQAANRELAEAAMRLPAVPDDLRAAMWQRAGGTVVSPALAIRGAAIAMSRHEPALAEDLLHEIVATEDGAAPMFGRALHHQRRYDEAERFLATRNSSDPTITGELASVRAQNLAYGLGRVADATDVLSRAAQAIADDGLRARLDTERGRLSAIRGDFEDALRAGKAVVTNPAAQPVALASAYVSLMLAHTMLGDCDAVDEIIQQATDAAGSVRQDLPFALDQVRPMEVNSDAVAGRVTRARALTRTYAEGPRAMRVTWLTSLGWQLPLSGLLREAQQALELAKTLAAESDPFRMEFMARGMLAMTLGQLGDPSASAEVADIRFDQPEPRLTIWVERGRSWAAAAVGETEHGAELAVAGAVAGIAGQHPAWAALALHDAVRLGHPELAIEALHGLVGMRGAHLVETMRDHADALIAQDGERLLGVGGTFEAMGGTLLAAEASAHAATAFHDQNLGARAAVAATLSLGWERMCQEPRTPALRSRPPVVTQRESEIALDAALGQSSATIAAARFISVRTVDNHLRSIYRKLDVSGRDELTAALAPLTDLRIAPE